MVSVIIPVYNGEKYIKKCLDSLLAGDTEGLEVIIVNDGSRDGSSELLRGYAEKYSSVRLIEKENGGAASARQAGLSVATGDFVAFLDIDDLAEPNMYSELEKKAIESGADIVFCDYIEESSKGSRRVANTLPPDTKLPLDGRTATDCLHTRQAVFPFPWNKIYKRELLLRVKFPERNFVGEDYDMLLQLFAMTDKIDYLNIAPYHYVLTENSASRSGYGEATLLAYRNFQKNNCFIHENYPQSMSEYADNYIVTEYMAIIIAMGRNKVYNKPLIKKIKSFVRRSLGSYLSAPYVPLTMKGSAIALTVSYRLLIFAYRLIK